jgi:hypothetical protein
MKSVGAGDGLQVNRIGIVPPEIVSQFSGLEVLRKMLDGELAYPAISESLHDTRNQSEFCPTHHRGNGQIENDWHGGAYGKEDGHRGRPIGQ